MSYGAKVILDSISDAGIRITTAEFTMPKPLQAEFNTHRMFSRSSASSRAIPLKKMVERIQADPWVPQKLSKNQKGMQAAEPLTPTEYEAAKVMWLYGRDQMIDLALKMGDPEGLNVHKQWVNRLIEPWMWTTIIVTATEFENFRGLRVSPEAQPDFEIAARMLMEAIDASQPTHLKPGEWHLPYIAGDGGFEQHTDQSGRWSCKQENGNWIDYSTEDVIKISSARCARVSYLTQDGKRDPSEDLALYQRILAGPHLVPMEHPAQALANPIPIGNFVGWLQHRKWIPGEAVHKRADDPHAVTFTELEWGQLKEMAGHFDEGSALYKKIMGAA